MNTQSYILLHNLAPFLKLHVYTKWTIVKKEKKNKYTSTFYLYFGETD